MSLRLEVISGPDKGVTYDFSLGDLTIGRDQNHCGLILSDSGASRLHARISPDSNNTFFIEDLNSTNGTHVNEQLIRGPVSISLTDRIRIGESELIITMRNEVAQVKSLPASGKVITIGRDPTNDLVIDSTEVSRLHARIFSEGEHFYLEDLNSSNGTALDGNRISGKVFLKPASWLMIGGHKLYFDGKAVISENGTKNTSFSDFAPQATTNPFVSAMTAPFSASSMLKFLLGSILAVIPILFIFADGYRYRLMKAGAQGDFTLPEWNNWGDLFLKGIIFFLVRFVYLLIPAALFISLLAYTNYAANLSLAVVSIALAVIMLTYLFAGIIIPMGWASYAASDNFRDAFVISDLVYKIRQVLQSYFSALLLVLCLWLISILLVLIPGIGFFIGILAMFYIYVVSSLIFGDIYTRADSSNIGRPRTTAA